jgi:lipoate-protein ligase A
MALDHALVGRAARTGEAVLRVYTWRGATVSFGRHQPGSLYDRAAIAAAELGVVRRPTGGRAVLHDREITYSVTAPLAGEYRLANQRRLQSRALYAAINDLLIGAFARLGVSAVTADRSPPAAVSRPSTPAPCFDQAADGEVVAHGRKLVGSAKWRENGAVLQHGSILVADDQSRLAALMHDPAGPSAPTATLGALLGRGPTAREVAVALHGALDDALLDAGGRAADVLAIDAETADAVLALQAHYSDDAWTWRL